MSSVTAPGRPRGRVLGAQRVHCSRRTPSGPEKRLFMDFLRPARWEEALAAKAAHPAAVPIAGGTDVMVEINFDHRRPDHLLDLNRIAELQEWEVGAGTV